MKHTSMNPSLEKKMIYNLLPLPDDVILKVKSYLCYDIRSMQYAKYIASKRTELLEEIRSFTFIDYIHDVGYGNDDIEYNDDDELGDDYWEEYRVEMNLKMKDDFDW